MPLKDYAYRKTDYGRLIAWLVLFRNVIICLPETCRRVGRPTPTNERTPSVSNSLRRPQKRSDEPGRIVPTSSPRLPALAFVFLTLTPRLFSSMRLADCLTGGCEDECAPGDAGYVCSGTLGGKPLSTPASAAHN